MAQQNVKPNGYRPRIVDKQIERYMRIFGAVEIAGTKWCGKTWAARAHANSITYVDRDNNLPWHRQTHRLCCSAIARTSLTSGRSHQQSGRNSP